MLDCTYPHDFMRHGVNECLLHYDEQIFKAWRLFNCKQNTNCVAFILIFRNNQNDPICDVTNMSITIDGKLLPVNIVTMTNRWEMSLKDPLTRDAVVHWTIVPCEDVK